MKARSDRAFTAGRHRVAGIIGAIWGVAGIVLLLGSAVYRLGILALEGFSHAFTWYHWASLVVIVIAMGYAEGYKGFQKAFSPRVAARAKYLLYHPVPWHVILAPLFCMAYFHAPGRRKATSISVSAGIVVLILLVRLLHQPWRGIVDTGVVLGLAWGLVSLMVFCVKAFLPGPFLHPPEVPPKATEDETSQ